MEQRKQKGIDLLKQSIRNKNPYAVRQCLNRFKELGWLDEAIYGILNDCPIDILRSAEAEISIYSEVLDRIVKIPEEWKWNELERIARMGLEKEDLKLIDKWKCGFNATLIKD
jgi:hypothetical protein